MVDNHLGRHMRFFRIKDCLSPKASPKVSYKIMVIIAMFYVSALTIWGWVMDNFGSFISLAAYIQGPIIGMSVVDYLLVKRRRLSLKAAYYRPGHDAYRFTGGFNLVGLVCLTIAFATCMMFVYNPLSGTVKSPVFLALTGSGYTAVCGGFLYWLASVTPLRRYMLRDRNDIEVV